MKEEKDNFFEDNDVNETVNRFEKMLQRNAQLYFDVEEFESIIDYYIVKEKYASAIQATDYACSQHPSSSSIQIKRAQIFIDNKKLDESLKILSSLERIEASNFDVLFLKAQAYLLKKNIDKAIQYFEKSLEILHEGRIETILDIAGMLDQNQYLTHAEKYLLQAHKEDDNNKNVIFELAFLNERFDRMSKAIKYYNMYLDINPFSEIAWFNMAYCYNSLEKYKKAIEAYDFALALNPEYTSAHFNKANSLANLGEFKQSIDSYYEFIQLEPDYAHAYYYIAECYVKLEDTTQSLRFYLKAIEKDNDFADAYFGMALIALNEEKYDESLEFLKKALSIDEKNSEYLFVVGKILLKTRRLEEAIRNFKEVVHIDKYDVEAWYSYAYALFLTGEIADAIDILRKALVDNKQDGDLTLHLAALLIEKGDEEEGLLYFSHGLEFDASGLEVVFEFYPILRQNAAVAVLVAEMKK